MAKEISIQELEWKKRPVTLSQQGFVGANERQLITVLTEDADTLEKLGVTCSQLANELETILSIVFSQQWAGLTN